MEPYSCSSRIKEEVLKNRFFRIARNEMFKSDHDIRLGAVLVLNKSQYYVACNSALKTHPIIKKHYPHYVKSIHAEISALIKYNEVRFGPLPKNTRMYVYREDKNGIMKKSKPCKCCEEILRENGVRKVFYSTQFGFEMKVL